MQGGSTFIGRDREVAELLDLLANHGVITITGPGGIGKTRLSTEIATRSGSSFGGRVFFAELTSVDPEDEVHDVVARQLGHASLEALRLSTHGRATLLVVDNCEHVLTQAGRLVSELTSEDNGISVVATSRVPLGVAGERVYPIEPLALPSHPDAQDVVRSSAVQLFLERSQSAGALWPPSPGNLKAVGQIVGRLDGMPLAIELAAAQTRAISPGDLLGLLDRQLDLLKRPNDQTPQRHQSIRGAIRTSYEPLGEPQQELFRRLGYFRDTFDLHLAHGVAGSDDKITTLELLSDLVDHSLVATSYDDQGRTGYRLLEPIRAYAHEQLELLDEAPETEERFVAVAASFADEIVAAAFESFSSEVIDRIADRYVHLLQAIESCVSHDDTPARAYRLFLPLYAPTGAPRTEVARLGARVLARWPDTDAPLHAEALAVMAHASLFAGEHDVAGERARTAITHSGGSALAKTVGHRVLAYVAGMNGDSAEALSHLEAAMTAAESVGGSFLRELRVSWAAMVVDPSRSPEALALLARSTAEAAELDETITLVWAAVASAHHHLLLQNPTAALRATGRAVELAELTASPWALCAAHRLQASVLSVRDGWDAAAPTWRIALEDVIAIGDIEGLTLTMRTAAAAALFTGEVELAEQLWNTAPSRRGVSVLPPLFADEDATLRARLGSPIPVGLSESVRVAREILIQPTVEPEPTTTTSTTALKFGDYVLDLGAHELRHEGVRVHIEPQVFDVLAYLARQPGQMVPRDELLDEVWGDRFVSPSALTSRIKSARAATGDDGKTQAVIRTVHGRGFMFVAEIS